MAGSRKGEKKSQVTASDLRALDIKDLKSKLADERDELMRARFRHATAALENTSELKARRRLIARISTVLNEKEQRG